MEHRYLRVQLYGQGFNDEIRLKKKGGGYYYEENQEGDILKTTKVGGADHQPVWVESRRSIGFHCSIGLPPKTTHEHKRLVGIGKGLGEVKGR